MLWSQGSACRGDRRVPIYIRAGRRLSQGSPWSDVLDEAVPDRVNGCLRAVRDAEFFEDRRNVTLHGLRGEHQTLRDLAVGQPFSDERQDLALALGEAAGLGG